MGVYKNEQVSTPTSKVLKELDGVRGTHDAMLKVLLFFSVAFTEQLFAVDELDRKSVV